MHKFHLCLYNNNNTINGNVTLIIKNLAILIISIIKIICYIYRAFSIYVKNLKALYGKIMVKKAN